MTSPQMPHDHGQEIARIIEQMPDVSQAQEAAEVFQQLGDPSRLRILWLLCHAEECGINIAAAVGMSSASVSHHLKSLRLHGLIQSRRSGKEVYDRLADNEKAQLIRRMVDDYIEMACTCKGVIHSAKE